MSATLAVVSFHHLAFAIRFQCNRGILLWIPILKSHVIVLLIATKWIYIYNVLLMSWRNYVILELKLTKNRQARHFNWRLHLCRPWLLSRRMEHYPGGVIMVNWNGRYVWNNRRLWDSRMELNSRGFIVISFSCLEIMQMEEL